MLAEMLALSEWSNAEVVNLDCILKTQNEFALLISTRTCLLLNWFDISSILVQWGYPVKFDLRSTGKRLLPPMPMWEGGAVAAHPVSASTIPPERFRSSQFFLPYDTPPFVEATKPLQIFLRQIKRFMFSKLKSKKEKIRLKLTLKQVLQTFFG